MRHAQDYIWSTNCFTKSQIVIQRFQRHHALNCFPSFPKMQKVKPGYFCEFWGDLKKEGKIEQNA